MLNLYDILLEVLNENVSPSDVVDAIKNKYQVIITYSDEENRAPKKRLIEPYVYGLSKAGNSVFRAYQYEGDTYRGIPKWKLFRLDRITSWTPTNVHFNAEPKERGWNAEDYNSNGDNSMSTVLTQVSLHDNSFGDNPYEKGSDLYNIRNRTNTMKASNPIKINQMKDAEYGPIQNKTTNSVADKNTPEFQKMLDKNLKITQKEKEKRGFSLSNGNNRGPIVNANDKNNTQQSDDDFKKMLDRNMEITRKEKERRGFSLNNNQRSQQNNNSKDNIR